MHLQISLQVGQSFAPAGMQVTLVYVCNICRPEITPFRAMNNLENLGPLVGAQENHVCLNRVYFMLKSLSSATELCQNVQCRLLYGKDLYRIGEQTVG